MLIDELVKQAKTGNKQAFSELYDQFADRIFRFIRMKIANSQDAEDILQTVFIKAWQGLRGYNLEQANFSAWLYKIAANCTYDFFRKSARRPENLELDENIYVISPEDPAGNLNLSSDLQDLKKKLDSLPKQYKEVLELRFVQDFTLQETAEILKKSNLSVRLLVHRALKKLKSLI
jgi:RNA polymerase sigma-70 factor (ECF subfamily)